MSSTITTRVRRTLSEASNDPFATVHVPTYDRSALQPGVVHFGIGGFHRAHQALYLDKLAERGETGWGVVGVGLHRSEMQRVLAAQDHLFLVLERNEHGEEARIVASIIDCLFAPEQPAAVLAALTDPRAKLVTLTVTGAGYPVDPATGLFDSDRVADDLLSPGRPASVFGFLVEALRLRREAGIPPFTVLSCDNVSQNGGTTRSAVVGRARAGDPELAEWIDEHVAFPSSMVDRITPATSPADREEIAERLGIDDGWPVVTEPFTQWVIEDRFSDERPPLDLVGAQFVADVRPYELMKTRLLNGSHCALGYLGLLLDHERGDDAMGDEVVARYLPAMMDEVIPTLQPVDGIDLTEYRDQLIARFSNPRIGDRLDRLAGRGSTKLASYVVPSIVEARKRGADHRLLAGTVAAWIMLLARPFGTAPLVEDPLRDELVPLAERGDVRGILRRVKGFSTIAGDAVVSGEIERSCADIREHGPRAALEALVAAARPTSAHRSRPSPR